MLNLQSKPKIKVRVHYSFDGANERVEHFSGFSKAYAFADEALSNGAYWADIFQELHPNCHKPIRKSA